MKITDFLQYFRLLHYTDDNEGFFLLLLYILLILTFLTFGTYIFCLIKSFNNKNLENYYLTLQFLRISMNALSSVLLIPLEEYFLTIIVGDSEQYFKEKLGVWTTKHIIHVILCVLALICLLIIIHITMTHKFNKKEKFSSSTSKHLIMNSSIINCYIRTLTVVFLEILVLLNILGFVVFYMFLSSLYNVICYYIEKKFKSDENIIAIINYNLNLIYFWDCTCLFCGKILVNTKFNGFLEIFFVGVVLIIIFNLTFPNQKIKPSSESLILKNENEIYNQIRLILKGIETYKNNRENLLYLYGYLSQNIKEKKNKKDNLNLTQIFANNKSESQLTNEEIEFYLYQHIDDLFKEAINFYQDSILLLVSYSIFQLEKLERFNKAYLNLCKISERKNLTLEQDFYIYRIKRRIEEKGLEDGTDNTNLSFKFQCNLLINMISEVATIYSYFWNLLLNSNEYEDINKLNNYGFEINNLSEKIKNKFSNLQNTTFNSSKISKLYGYFIRDILNEIEEANKYFNNDIEETEDIFQTKFIDVNNLVSTADFQFIIASGKSDSIGNILKISLGICSLLGYSDKELIGQNIDILIPDFIQKSHNNMIINRLNKNKLIENFEKNLKNLEVYLKCSSKCIVPFNFSVTITFDEDYNSIIFGKINFDIENSFFEYNYIILTNETLLIENFTANSMNMLGITDQSVINNIEFIQFIKEFNEDYYNKMINQPQFDKNQVKIKLLKQKYMKENVITWKTNNKKFKMICNEIKIEKKLLGYVFKFDLQNESNSSIISSNSPNVVSSNINNVNTFKSFDKNYSKKNNEIKDDFPLINKNFIPKDKENNINFDIENKMFLFKDNINGRKLNTVQDYFNEKYIKNNINNSSSTNSKDKNSKFSESNSEISSSNNNNNNSSSSFSDSSFSDEDDNNKSEKNNNLININNNSNNNNHNNQIDNYYKINFKNISFYIYDYKTNVLIDIKKFPKESKIEQIIQTEKIKRLNTHEFNIKDSNENNFNKKEKHIAFNIDSEINNNQNILNNNQNQKTKKILTERNLELINKETKPKILNTSIIYFILLYTLLFIIFFIVSLVYFLTFYSERKKILKTENYFIYQINLYREIVNTYFYSMELVLLKNDKYNNLYQNDRDEYYYECLESLSNIYNLSSKNLEIFGYTKLELSKKNQKKIDNIHINVTSFFYNNGIYDIITSTSSMKIIFSLSEFLFALFTFINFEGNEIFGANEIFLFLVFNIDNNIFGLDETINIYFDEIKKNVKFDKFLIYFCIGFFFIFQIVAIFFGIKTNNLILNEKEKYLKYFFKIDEENIKIILNKSKKFIKLNSDQSNNILSIPKFNFENENISYDSEKNNLINKNNEKKLKHKDNKINKKDHSNNNNNLILSNLKKHIYFLIFFYTFSFLIILITNIFVFIELSKIYHFSLIYYLTIFLEKNIYQIFNDIRSYNFFYILLDNNEYFKNKFNSRLENFYNLYSLTSNTLEYITGNISKYGLSKEAYDKYFTIDSDSLCEYFYNNSLLSNFTCEDFASNVSNYGLLSLSSYYTDTLFYIYSKITYQWNFVENYYNFTFNEIIYNSDEDNEYYLNYVLPSNSDDIELYQNINPFQIYNDNHLKDLTIVIIYIYKPSFESLIVSIQNVIKAIYDHIYNYILISNIGYYIVLIWFYFIYLLPYIIKKNIELNKNRKMLNIIPKEILFEIINKEKSNI